MATSSLAASEVAAGTTSVLEATESTRHKVYTMTMDSRIEQHTSRNRIDINPQIEEGAEKIMQAHGVGGRLVGGGWCHGKNSEVMRELEERFRCI